MNQQTMDLIIKISEGIPGALSILKKCSERDDLPQILAYLEGTETFGSKIWILFKDECGQDFEKFVKQCLPKYSPRTKIQTKSGKIGYIESVHWSKEKNCWGYVYSYGLGGASDGYILESNIRGIVYSKKPSNNGGGGK